MPLTVFLLLYYGMSTGGGVDSFFLLAFFEVLFGVCGGTWDKACEWASSTVFVRWYWTMQLSRRLVLCKGSVYILSSR